MARASGSYPAGRWFKSDIRYHSRPVGQAVKTRPFHGCNMGSIPVRVTKPEKALRFGVLSSFYRVWCPYKETNRVLPLVVTKYQTVPLRAYITIIYSPGKIPLGGMRITAPSSRGERPWRAGQIPVLNFIIVWRFVTKPEKALRLRSFS